MKDLQNQARIAANSLFEAAKVLHSIGYQTSAKMYTDDAKRLLEAINDSHHTEQKTKQESATSGD